MTIVRCCPLCASTRNKRAFPYSILFSEQVYFYYRCASCRTVFVDPLPNDQCFKQMYSKVSYHDAHYSDADSAVYRYSVKLLHQYSSVDSSVLDYGCGTGLFLKVAKDQGFRPSGIEFDSSAALAASEASGCSVFSVSEFECGIFDHCFDVIHMGDVLEHLCEPFSILSNLLQSLKPGGLLYVEGPLEVNPSPVYFASRLFGFFKHRLRPSHVNPGMPTHLFRTSARAQAAFFSTRFPQLRKEHWRVFETGWPYAQGPWLKRRIAHISQLLGGQRLLGFTFGNRFEAIYRLLW